MNNEYKQLEISKVTRVPVGCWMKYKENRYQCSFCGNVVSELTAYCPDCGCEMMDTDFNEPVVRVGLLEYEEE